MIINTIKLLSIFILSAWLAASYASTSSSPPSLDQFLNNPESMTKQLEGLSKNFNVTVLSTGEQDNSYKRLASLNLDKKPMIIALSEAKGDSPYFVKLLQNADTTPLGKILFAPNSPAVRDPGMEVNMLKLKQILDPIVQNKISNLGYKQDTVIYERISIFRKREPSTPDDSNAVVSIDNDLSGQHCKIAKPAEYLRIAEYILPSIQPYLSH